MIIMKLVNQPDVLQADLEALIKDHPLGRPLIGVLFYNNGESGRLFLEKFNCWPMMDVILHDDGSTDETADILNECDYPILRSETNGGLGSAIKRVIRYANQYDRKVVVIMAGNNKDDPNQIPRLLAPIYCEDYDYVQGSRRLQGGGSPDIPIFRRLMVPVHALLVRMLTGFPGTDALNGFRAYKIRMLYDDSRFNIWQDWLDQYELETYIHYNVLKNGYRVKEVPVTKSYSHFNNGMKYSHIRPFSGWWSILRPLFYLGLGLRK
jgi:dolichol-phosphate mannosyltransferase